MPEETGVPASREPERSAAPTPPPPSKMSGVVGATRFLVAIAIASTLVLFAALLVAGAWRTVTTIIDVVFDQTDDSLRELRLAVIEVVDVVLIATVLFILAAGLYQLFLDQHLPVPAWLRVDHVGDLEATVGGMVVVVLAVAFLGEVITWDQETDLLGLGVAVGAVIAALALFLRARQEERHAPRDRRAARSPDAEDP